MAQLAVLQDANSVNQYLSELRGKLTAADKSAVGWDLFSIKIPADPKKVLVREGGADVPYAVVLKKGASGSFDQFELVNPNDFSKIMDREARIPLTGDLRARMAASHPEMSSVDALLKDKNIDVADGKIGVADLIAKNLIGGYDDKKKYLGADGKEVDLKGKTPREVYTANVNGARVVIDDKNQNTFRNAQQLRKEYTLENYKPGDKFDPSKMMREAEPGFSNARDIFSIEDANQQIISFSEATKKLLSVEAERVINAQTLTGAQVTLRPRETAPRARRAEPVPEVPAAKPQLPPIPGRLPDGRGGTPTPAQQERNAARNEANAALRAEAEALQQRQQQPGALIAQSNGTLTQQTVTGPVKGVTGEMRLPISLPTDIPGRENVLYARAMEIHNAIVDGRLTADDITKNRLIEQFRNVAPGYAALLEKVQANPKVPVSLEFSKEYTDRVTNGVKAQAEAQRANPQPNSSFEVFGFAPVGTSNGNNITTVTVGTQSYILMREQKSGTTDVDFTLKNQTQFVSDYNKAFSDQYARMSVTGLPPAESQKVMDAINSGSNFMTNGAIKLQEIIGGARRADYNSTAAGLPPEVNAAITRLQRGDAAAEVIERNIPAATATPRPQ